MNTEPPPGWPAWLPFGVFGEAADEMVAATIENMAALCSSALCDSVPSEERISGCVSAELRNFAPTPEWLACASRNADNQELFRQRANALRGCAAAINAGTPCVVPPCDLSAVPLNDDECGTRRNEVQAFLCLDHRVEPPRRCDGEVGCPDGDDESNCDPLADRYDCAHGQLIEWEQLCNGTADCDNGSDELLCNQP